MGIRRQGDDGMRTILDQRIKIYQVYVKMNTKKQHKRAERATTKKRAVATNDLFSFQKKVTVTFLEMLLMIKLFHWKTVSYAAHKASDELYEKLNTNMDSFIEILLGKSQHRTNLLQKKTIRLIDLPSKERMKQEMERFKGWLLELNEQPAMKQMSNNDLFNIRDTLLGDVNQFLYLLTFK